MMTRASLFLNGRFAGALIIFLLTMNLSDGGPPYGTDVAIEKSSTNVNGARSKTSTPMHKVLLTQRGYIQFLRWELPVPEINEFTFCVWVKSTNLTYRHAIFSYSKNEKDRLVRAWISPEGQSIHLEIGDVEIFAHPASIREHRWYHICESWDNVDGRYAMWIDGMKKIDGYAPTMKGHVIPSKGDIVLGQEYTDFDKGLEEGVEGAVLGFNLVLSSAFDLSWRSLNEWNNDMEEGQIVGYDTDNVEPISYGVRTSVSSFFPRARHILVNHPSNNVPLIPRNRKLFNNGIGESRRKRKYSMVVDELEIYKPLGLRLIDTSYAHCERGRASPRIGAGKLMLISWTRTPVKIFGGAIVKNVKNDCGKFS